MEPGKRNKFCKFLQQEVLMTMSFPVGLDLDLLRSFVIIAEERSFTRAAELVGRTQSAVSLQMQRLEASLGQPVLAREKGGHVELTEQGRYFLVKARELLSLNDEILASVKKPKSRVSIKFGIAEELAPHYLPKILEHFAQISSSVEVEVFLASSCILSPQIRNGEIDLAILESGLEPRNWPTKEVWRSKLVWITSNHHQQHLRTPLPLALSPVECPWRPPWLHECPFRTLATKSLERDCRAFQVVTTSSSMAAQLGAVRAGLAVAVALDSTSLLDELRQVREDEGLPLLPDVAYLMMKSRNPPQPHADLLSADVTALFS